MKVLKWFHYWLREDGGFIPIGLVIIGSAMIILSILPSLNDQPSKTHTTKITHTALPTLHTWTKADSLAYAHDQVIKDAQAQFVCLSNLWGKESAWNPKAQATIKSQGKYAGGIPQLLGLSPLTPPTLQIERGLAYITFRYYTPCKAWQHFQHYNWY